MVSIKSSIQKKPQYLAKDKIKIMEIQLEQWIVIVGVLSPFVTALAAKSGTPDWFKGVLSICTAVVAGVVNQLLTDGSFDLTNALTDASAVWSTHLLTWLGISSAAVAAVHEKTKDAGVALPAAVSSFFNKA